MSTFSGLEMGKRALQYYRQGMETAGHNISNADVDGFSRQRVEVSTTAPYADVGLSNPWTAGQLGTGVKVDAIVRIRDAFLDAQYIEETSVQGYWETLEEALDYAELFVNEPLTNEEGGTFKTALDSLWSSLQELAKRPDDTSVRDALLEESQSLTTYLNQLSTNYSQYRDSLNEDLALKVEEANTYIDQIAALNVTIKEVQGTGGNPNDLLDRRDLLVEKLAGLVDINVSDSAYNSDGDFKIDIDGKLLVQGGTTRHLVLASVAGNEGYYDVQIESNTFDYVDNPDVVTVGFSQSSPEAVHDITVRRLATETAWKIGQATDPETGLGRLKPQSADEALGIKGTFSLQVGSSGTQVTSAAQKNGVVLSNPGTLGQQEYSFRVAWGDNESVVDVTWDDTSKTWTLSDNSGAESVSTAGSDLTVDDLQSFLSGYTGLTANSDGTRLTLKSTDNRLLSLTDIKGDLLSGELQTANDAPVVTIEVTEEDSLETIRNKINGAYGSDGGPSSPDEWLVASIEEGTDGTFSLVLQSQVIGEAARINVLGDEQGSFYVAQRLGLVAEDGSTSVVQKAEDAVVTVDNFTYLSDCNDFSKARLVTSANGYRADTLQEVSQGMNFHLSSVGSATATVRHAVTGGEIAGLMTARDDYLLSHMNVFDELAYSLALEMNAVHYAGHGTGDNENVTGTAYFTPIATRQGAAKKLEVGAALLEDPSLLAASGDDGKGKSLGSGDGSNALAMAQLKQATVLSNGTASFDGYYESFIAQLGTQGQRATTMSTNQKALTDQIESQRQSVMGVNIDEEMMDIIKFQQAFNAMARYITTVDEMLDRVINGMGNVGR